MLDEVNEKQFTNLSQCESNVFAIAVLMLEYSVYQERFGLESDGQLMLELMKLIKKITAFVSHPEYRDIWRILPEIFVIILSSQNAWYSTLDDQTRKVILSSLDGIMRTSWIWGDFDLASAVINLLSKKASHFTYDHTMPQFESIFEQINLFLDMLLNTMGKTKKFSHAQICTAQTLYGLACDAQELMEKWPSAKISNNDLEHKKQLASQILQGFQEETEALNNTIKQPMVHDDKKKKTIKEQLKRNKQNTPKQSNAYSATSNTKTITKAKVTPTKPEQWDEHRDKAVKLFEQQKFNDGKKAMNRALQATQSNFNKALIYADCADAQLVAYKELLNLAYYLGDHCSEEAQKMEFLLDKAQDDFKEGPPPRRIAERWLRKHNFNNAENLIHLADIFPNDEEIKLAAAALKRSIDFSLKAITLFHQCQEEERESMELILELLMINLEKLNEKKHLIMSAKENLMLAMILRPKVLFLIGLYGATCKSNRGRPKQRNWLSLMMDKLKTSGEGFSFLYTENNDAQLGEFMSVINKHNKIKEQPITNQLYD